MAPNDPPVPPPLPDPGLANSIMGMFRLNKDLFNALVMQFEKEWKLFCERVDKLIKLGEDLVENPGVWGAISGWVGDINPFQDALVEILGDIRKRYKSLKETVDKLLPMIRLTAERSTPVLSLIEHSYIYLTEVFPKMGDVYNGAGGTQPDFQYWAGSTREHYDLQVLAGQVAAIDRTTDHVEGISAWLAETAVSNTDYMVAIVQNFSPVPNSLTAAALEVGVGTADFVNLFFAIDQLASSIGNLVQFAIDQAAELFGFLVSVLAGIRNLAAIRNERRDLPEGKWPQAVAG